MVPINLFTLESETLGGELFLVNFLVTSNVSTTLRNYIWTLFCISCLRVYFTHRSAYELGPIKINQMDKIFYSISTG